MTNVHILDTVDTYIARVMQMAHNARTNNEYIGFIYILAQLENFEDWYLKINRAI